MSGPTASNTAILVVYCFPDNLLPMVEQHLLWLKKCSPAGVKILGAPLRLSSNATKMLLSHGVELIDTKNHADMSKQAGPSDIHKENAYWIHRLADHAFKEGAELFVSLHQDSFPISPNWLQSLAPTASNNEYFSTIVPDSYSACLIWSREWQAKQINLQIDHQNPPDGYNQLKKKSPELNFADAGIGWLSYCEMHQLNWKMIKPSAPIIWADQILHLTGATRIGVIGHSDTGIKRFALPSLLAPLQGAIRGSSFDFWMRKLRDRATKSNAIDPREQKLAQIQSLTADPATFIKSQRALGIDPNSRQSRM